MNPPKHQRNLLIVARVLAGSEPVPAVASDFGICPKRVWEVVHGHCRRVDPKFYGWLHVRRPSADYRPSLAVLRAHHHAFTLDCYAEGLL